MVRTIGAKDKKKRKQRKTYAGKPIKKKRKRHGKFVPYVSKRLRDGLVKIWFWEQLPMNKDSYKNFSKETRKYMKRIIYNPHIRIDVDPYQISNKELVEQLCLENLSEGIWFMKMFSHAKNKYHSTKRIVAVIKITNHPEGLRAKMIENRKLWRYWFWEKS